MLHPKHKIDSIKEELFNNLLEAHAFWSYGNVCLENISDEQLIERVLIHLDIADINKLFQLYPKSEIKKVWKEVLCPLEPRYHRLNYFFARVYFGIKNPDRYIKIQQNRFIRKRTTSAQ